MSSSGNPLQFHFKNVLHQDPPAIFSKKTHAGLDKPEGFRIPRIYFGWGLLKGSRGLHHHPDNDELLLILEGKARVHLFGPGDPETRFHGIYYVSAGDIVLFPQGWVHSVEELGGDETLKVLAIFNHQEFASVEVEDLARLLYSAER